eukprot:TRINITY_DN6530_c0_g1_i2.p1 TRINITY_DN6530_c0_g1~~TRINITY_DN6530_c0_g1_i2.p1  ORF type:complete len:114 (-),score=15.49 TRINITY_DN6530_c0_g1_i2:107-448(-)
MCIRDRVRRIQSSVKQTFNMQNKLFLASRLRSAAAELKGNRSPPLRISSAISSKGPTPKGTGRTYVTTQAPLTVNLSPSSSLPPSVFRAKPGPNFNDFRPSSEYGRRSKSKRN